MYCQNPDTMKQKGGTYHKVDDLVSRAVNMKGYFGAKGGVTVSGGEPLLQSKTVLELFSALKAEGIHTNIDTNATVVTTDSKLLVEEHADLVMFDMKNTNKESFEEIAGFDGLDKALELIALREKAKKPYWIRYVLVPGYTNSDESLQWLIDTFSKNEYLERLQVIPYHKLGAYKWEALGIDYQLKDVDHNTPEQLKHVEETLTPHFKEFVI